MGKRDTILIWAIIIWTTWTLIGLGCSSLKVSQDYQSNHDFTQMKTFSWKDAVQKKNGDVRVDSQLIDDRIRRAVDQTMTKKGFMKAVETSPDLLVEYQYVISKKLESRPVSTGVGFGYGSWGRSGGVAVSTGTDIREYDEGLLLVNFLKPKTGEILWQGKSTRIVKTHSTPEKITKDIDTTIEKILDQFPPQ